MCSVDLVQIGIGGIITCDKFTEAEPGDGYEVFAAINKISPSTVIIPTLATPS